MVQLKKSNNELNCRTEEINNIMSQDTVHIYRHSGHHALIRD